MYPDFVSCLLFMSRLSWTNYGVSSGENVTQLLEYVTFAFPKLPVLVTPNVQFSCATPAVSIPNGTMVNHMLQDMFSMLSCDTCYHATIDDTFRTM